MLRRHLGPRENAALAYAALKAVAPEHRADIFETVQSVEGHSAGAPLPPLLSPMCEARFWASMASRSELKAYALAAFEAMDRADRTAFLAHVSGHANAGRAA